jgi:pyruvate,water dikinase
LDGYLTTIHDYAYLTINLTARDWGWILFRMVPALPRLLRNGVRHWDEIARPRYAETVARWQERPVDSLSATELLDGTQELVDAMASYLTALQVDAIGTAAGTEGLFTRVYDKMIKREGDPEAPVLLLGSDSTPIRAEKALYDLAQWCRERNDVRAYLLETPSSELAGQLDGGEAPPGVDATDWHKWQSRFGAHLKEYGHGIYDLDFAKPLPADDPRPLLETLKLFIRREGKDPHARQQESAERREQEVEAALARARGLKRWLFRHTLGWAQTFARVREDCIFDIGLGYPVVRRMLHELGRRLAEGGAIAEPDDVFWLAWDEARQGAMAVDSGGRLESLTAHIGQRKAVWEAEERATPPPQLPPKGRVMGIKTDAFMPVSAEDQTGEAIKGVGASPGQVTGPACVLLGPEDFHKMRPGDILVAEITTPAWTPLFAMAAGVVTDIGGPLSHGSIVAREYGIPAVLGTSVATQRIQSGQVIRVNGSAGTVTPVQ